MTDDAPLGVRPAPGVAGVVPYRVPPPSAPVDLVLSGNEGVVPPAAVLDDLVAAGPEVLRRYPDAAPFERQVADRFGLLPEQVLVSAGADDALLRAFRAVLAPGREVVLPVPTFEMFERFAHLTGATLVTVDWPGDPYPTEAVLAATTPRTAAIVVVSPNNPTGAVATASDLARLSAAAPQALLVVDLAYVEFADDDLTAAALALPNAVVFRTMSKAWGLAGLRVGWALGPAAVIGWMRAAGLPYAVSGPTLRVAAARLRDGDAAVADFRTRVVQQRTALAGRLAARGGSVWPSQANFVLARLPDAGWLRDGLAGLGIGVRGFPGHPLLADCVRIACPGEAAAFARLEAAVDAVLAPEALLFDMDGVLVDVSQSYRRAIVETAAEFGVALTAEDVAAGKAGGQASNDWVLTRRLLAARGVDVPLETVTQRFEALYQGTADRAGLRLLERLLPPRPVLERLADRLPLAVVTGRPAADVRDVVARLGLDGLFETVVCMEDAPGKPDPAPVRLALARLGVARAWMVGDSPDDMRAARGAGVVPLGVVAPGDGRTAAAAALTAAGAARILEDVSALAPMLAPGRPMEGDAR